MGWWTIFAAVSTGAAAVVAIAYTIYEAYKREEAQSHRGRTRNDRRKSSDFESYEEIKRKARDSDLRHRNVSKSVCQSEKESVMGKGAPVSDNETQTEDCHSPELIMPDDKQIKLNSDDIEFLSSSDTIDETESICDSLASTETITSDIDQDLRAHSIPTWWEMPDFDRNSSVCKGCNEQVTTITDPCEHPYLCSECAPILIRNYGRCLLCQNRISGYKSIENI